uniref:Uncharacterized protein n=1 Tax=Bionectria ochroleuca TaxID=29856 RepID=A0A8H7MZC9_BIOOC
MHSCIIGRSRLLNVKLITGPPQILPSLNGIEGIHSLPHSLTLWLPCSSGLTPGPVTQGKGKEKKTSKPSMPPVFLGFHYPQEIDEWTRGKRADSIFSLLSPILPCWPWACDEGSMAQVEPESPRPALELFYGVKITYKKFRIQAQGAS